MPAVLVAAVAAAGHRVLPIPGASSAVAALSAAGDVLAEGFAFIGFAPAKGAERRAWLQAAAAAPGNQVLFEAPHRIEALATALAEAAPQRRITVCRELTKQFESIHTLPAADWPAKLQREQRKIAHAEAHAKADGTVTGKERHRLDKMQDKANRARGEFVLVLHALPAVVADSAALPAEAERLLGPLLRELPLKQAVALAAELSGTPRNPIYQRALALRQAEDPAD
jgi:16S rRNA (cytidine1402-2'-O)-methyltransferase